MTGENSHQEVCLKVSVMVYIPLPCWINKQSLLPWWLWRRRVWRWTRAHRRSYIKAIEKRHLVTEKWICENNQSYKNNQYYILKGHVHHSMKNLFPLNTEVCASIMSGFVKSASCGCKTGLVGQCSNVAAVLLMLGNYISENDHVVKQLTW